MSNYVYIPPPDIGLTVVYQDAHLIVLSKPSGLLCVPGRGAAHYDSLYSRLLRTHPTATVVHRLDMATSGLVVFALTKPCEQLLSKLFQSRSVDKHYVAWVNGALLMQHGVVDKPLITDWPNRPRQMIDFELGKAAQTRYSLKYYQSSVDRSLLDLFPITGRSHQLRVHMLSLGNPIAGDELYGGLRAQDTRMLLHATTLSFVHPYTNQRLTIVDNSNFEGMY